MGSVGYVLTLRWLDWSQYHSELYCWMENILLYWANILTAHLFLAIWSVDIMWPDPLRWNYYSWTWFLSVTSTICSVALLLCHHRNHSDFVVTALCSYLFQTTQNFLSTRGSSKILLVEQKLNDAQWNSIIFLSIEISTGAMSCLANLSKLRYVCVPLALK